MKTVVITGGQGDIAQEIAALLALKGYTVINPPRCLLDVSQESMVSAFFEKQKYDILINNAGVISPQSIPTSDSAIWKQEIDVNLIGTYLCCKYMLTENPKATIINIGSSAAYSGKALWSGYSAAKAGVMRLTESLIAEGFDAYCLNIGRTATKMRQKLCGQEDPSTLLSPKDVAIEILEILTIVKPERIYRLQK